MTATMTTVTTSGKLSLRELLFIEAYIGRANGNGAKAATIAGYAHGAQAAYKLLKRSDVKAAIVERYKDSCMSSDEVLARLAAMARATLDDALETALVVEYDHDNLPCTYNAETGEGIPTREVTRISMELLRESGLVHQVQSISYNQWGPVIKLADKQGALDKIARALGLYQGEGTGMQVIIKDLRGVDVSIV